MNILQQTFNCMVTVLLNNSTFLIFIFFVHYHKSVNNKIKLLVRYKKIAVSMKVIFFTFVFLEIGRKILLATLA